MTQKETIIHNGFGCQSENILASAFCLYLTLTCLNHIRMREYHWQFKINTYLRCLHHIKTRQQHSPWLWIQTVTSFMSYPNMRVPFAKTLNRDDESICLHHIQSYIDNLQFFYKLLVCAMTLVNNFCLLYIVYPNKRTPFVMTLND